MLVKESKWTKMFFGEGQASLSFSHLNKDDEGLYTLRVVSRGGVSEHSAFLFVRGTRSSGLEGGRLGRSSACRARLPSRAHAGSCPGSEAVTDLGTDQNLNCCLSVAKLIESVKRLLSAHTPALLILERTEEPRGLRSRGVGGAPRGRWVRSRDRPRGEGRWFCCR